MSNRRLTGLVVACCLAGVSCAARAVRWTNSCDGVELRLRQSWAALEDSRSQPDGCALRNGVNPCETQRADIERLADECPSHTPALMANAVLAYDAKQIERAQQLLDTIFSQQAIYPDAAVLRGRIALQEGNLPFALRFLSEQIRISPDHAGLRETYASALYLSRHWDEARAQLGVAEGLGAPGWRTAYHRGLIEEALGNFAEAERHYGQALKERPDWRPAESRLIGIRARGPRGGS